MVAISHSTAIAAITTVSPAPLPVISICTPAATAAKPMSDVMTRYVLLPWSNWSNVGTTALAEAAKPSARTATPVARVLVIPGSAEPMAHSKYRRPATATKTVAMMSLFGRYIPFLPSTFPRGAPRWPRSSHTPPYLHGSADSPPPSGPNAWDRQGLRSCFRGSFVIQPR
jgi:hypothetical protein